MRITGTTTIRYKRDYTAILKEIREAFTEEVKADVVADFDDVTSDWETDVTFDARVEVQGGNIVIGIGPRRNSRIWRYVDEGTRAHAIRAKRGKFLEFRGGYSSRTAPGRAHVGTGHAYGPLTYRHEVWHPGTKARDFTKIILRKWRPEIARVIRDAIKGAT
jgi:hypothetical protein